MKRTNLVITIIGNVASGKTMITSLLSKNIPAKRIPADEFFRVNPFFPHAVKDRQRWSLASDLWFLYKRVEMLHKAFDHLNKSDVLIDSGLPMSYVYAHSRLASGFYTKNEWELYKTYYNLLSEKIQRSDLIISLEAGTDFLLRRIQKRRRTFELKYFTKDYLMSINKSLESFKRLIKKTRTKLILLNIEKEDLLYNRPALQAVLAKINLNGKQKRTPSDSFISTIK